MQQQTRTRRTVPRMDETAAARDTAEYEEIMSRARRASRNAQRASRHAARLLDTIKEVTS